MQTFERFTKIALTLAIALGLSSQAAFADTYTDVLGDGQGSANLLRDLASAEISNDANNLYIKLNMNPGANLATVAGLRASRA